MEDVSLHVFKHKIELVILTNDFFQLHNVRVIQLSQRLNVYTKKHTVTVH